MRRAAHGENASMAMKEKVAGFEGERRRLLRIGYRMLGSLSEAEDVVQDAWLRFAAVEDVIDTPAAYLTRIVTRLCLDRLKSARTRRELYIGPWLPEPLIGPVDPAEATADDVTLTLMLALERLSPLERAAFLLHDIFDVPLREVAVALGREPAAVRQLASRARRHVQEARPRYSVDADEGGRIARAFFEATRDGDTAALSALLAKEVEIHTDGGGHVRAFRNIVRGRDAILRAYTSFARKTSQAPVLLRMAVIDGLPGFVSRDGREVLQTTALAIREGRIAAIYIVRNPEKLAKVKALVRS